MTLYIRLLRLGRIYRPKFNIILFKNYKPITELGVMHPFNDLKIGRNNKKVKVLKLYFNKIYFWQRQGLILPTWLDNIIAPLALHQKYSGLKINYYYPEAHSLLANGGLHPIKYTKFLRGKTHGRAMLNTERLSHKNIKNK